MTSLLLSCAAEEEAAAIAEAAEQDTEDQNDDDDEDGDDDDDNKDEDSDTGKVSSVMPLENFLRGQARTPAVAYTMCLALIALTSSRYVHIHC